MLNTKLARQMDAKRHNAAFAARVFWLSPACQSFSRKNVAARGMAASYTNPESARRGDVDPKTHMGDCPLHRSRISSLKPKPPAGNPTGGSHESDCSGGL